MAAGIATLGDPHRPGEVLVNRRAKVLPFRSSGPEDLEGQRMGAAWRKSAEKEDRMEHTPEPLLRMG